MKSTVPLGGDTRPPYEPRLLVVIWPGGVTCTPIALTEGEAETCKKFQAFVRPALDALAAEILNGWKEAAA
jgi:hypothetical protein